MSLSKVPKILPSTPTRPRNAFDLSQRHLFTAPAGMLLPVLSLDLMPHDHVEINATDFMRTMPMNSSAFTDMRGIYEFFFVPYHQIWSPFDQFITGMSDYHSNFLSAKYHTSTPESIPAFGLSDFLARIKGDLDSASNGNSASNLGYDVWNFPNAYGALRLLDLLGYGNFANSDFKSLNPVGAKLAANYNSRNYFLNPFRIASYQKIYNDWYRNSTYENYDVDSFNMDDGISHLSNRFTNSLFTIRYRNLGLDYSTNIRPSLLFKPSTLPRQWFSGDMPSASSLNHQTKAYLPNYDNTVAVGSNVSSNPGSSDFSIVTTNSIRNAFALEKLLDLTMRAGKTYKEQMQALFGVDVPVGRDHRCERLGGFSSDFQIGDVTQTSGSFSNGGYTSSDFLGRTTGKATASGNGRIVYDAKEHGVLMCIYSLVPQANYDSTRLDPFNQKLRRGDYFIAQFENLGMQPLYRSSLSFFSPVSHLNEPKFDSDSLFNFSLGWQPRYSEYKTALDINHGQFSSGQPLSYWSSSRYRSLVDRDVLRNYGLHYYKIDPHYVDDIFSVDYNGTEVTDCVFGGCYFNIIKVSDMSDSGLPRL